MDTRWPESDKGLLPLVFIYLTAVHRLYLKRQRDEESRLAQIRVSDIEGE